MLLGEVGDILEPHGPVLRRPGDLDAWPGAAGHQGLGLQASLPQVE